MMRPTPEQPMCGDKNRYSKKEAYRARKVIGTKRGKDMRVYQCDKCFGWHITKHKGDQGVRITKTEHE